MAIKCGHLIEGTGAGPVAGAVVVIEGEVIKSIGRDLPAGGTFRTRICTTLSRLENVGEGPSPEASFFYLVGRDGKAERLSKNVESPILAGLAQEFKLCRFYFNRKFEKEFAGQFRKFGIG